MEAMNNMQSAEANFHKSPEWRKELDANMKATQLLIAQMGILNDQLKLD
jgi:hypothetical protein